MGNTVQIKIDVKKFKGNLQKVFKKALDKPTLDTIGAQVLDLTRKDIRAGNNHKTGQKLPKLGDSWIERRKRIAPRNELGPGFSPRRSNLTFSGQFLNYMSYKTVFKEVKIFFLDARRRPYRGVKNNELAGRGLSNKKLAQYHSERIGPFMGLTPEAKERVRLIIARRLNQLLRLFR